jgi:RHS repeat-associated protein
MRVEMSLSNSAYDSFGNNAGSARTRYTYTGRERDPDTGLLYYRARFYDPHLGRFVSEDPLELRGGINFYSYVQNDPLRFVDPMGLTRCNRLLGALGGAALGAGIGGLAGEAVSTGAGALVGLAGGPGGAVVGGGVGAIAGVPMSLVTAGGGAVIGGFLGYRYCASDDVMPKPKAVPTCDSPPKALPLPPSNNDFCYARWLAEDAQCWQWRRLGLRVVNACKVRAADRRTLCYRNGGRPNPEEPPEYTPFRDYPR